VLTEVQATLFAALLEGALKTLGYAVASKEVGTGFVRLRAVRGG